MVNGNVVPTLLVGDDQKVLLGQAINLADLVSFYSPAFNASTTSHIADMRYRIDWGDNSTAGTGTIAGAVGQGPTAGSLGNSHTGLPVPDSRSTNTGASFTVDQVSRKNR